MTTAADAAAEVMRLAREYRVTFGDPEPHYVALAAAVTALAERAYPPIDLPGWEVVTDWKVPGWRVSRDDNVSVVLWAPTSVVGFEVDVIRTRPLDLDDTAWLAARLAEAHAAMVGPESRLSTESQS